MPLIQEGRKTTGAVEAARLDTTTAPQAASKTIQRTQQMGLSLMDRLNQFSGKALELGTKEMVLNAKKKAVVDVQSGKFEEFGLHDNGSVYGMAYDGSGETAYISQTNTEAQAAAKRVAAENKYNPDGFMKAWESHKKEISKNSKKISPYVDAVTADVAEQYGDAAYAGIASNLATIQFDLAKKENTEALTLYEDAFISAKIAGNDNAAQTALINRNKTLESMQRIFQISERGIAAANTLFQKSVVVSQVKNRFLTAMQEGESAQFLAEFRDVTKKDENFAAFTPDEIQGIIDDMHKTIKSENSLQTSILKQEETRKKVIHDDVVNTFDNAWLTGDLSQSDIDLALKTDTIDQTEHKFYSIKVNDTGARFTNTATELRVSMNLPALTNNDIMNLHDMRNVDKMKYIKQLKDYRDSEGGKWTSTVQGRAALDLLKNKYNIIGADMMAKYNKDTDIADYGRLYQSFILEMEKLPPEIRESRSMHFAQAAIDVQDAAKIEAGTSSATNTIETQRKNLETRMQSYQRRIGKTKSQSYVKGLAEFQDDFGTTGDIDFSIRKEWRK